MDGRTNGVRRRNGEDDAGTNIHIPFTHLHTYTEYFIRDGVSMLAVFRLFFFT